MVLVSRILLFGSLLFCSMSFLRGSSRWGFDDEDGNEVNDSQGFQASGYYEGDGMSIPAWSGVHVCAMRGPTCTINRKPHGLNPQPHEPLLFGRGHSGFLDSDDGTTGNRKYQ